MLIFVVEREDWHLLPPLPPKPIKAIGGFSIMTEERRGRSLRPIGSVPAFPNDQGLMIADRVGMSKREHFASLILAGMNANPERSNSTLVMVSVAIAQADELIAQFKELAREDS